MPDVKLHRCPFTFLPESMDPCTRVQNALDEQGISYELRREWGFPRNRRKLIIEKTGQERLPVVEFAEGSAYREESKDMAATIRGGKLFERSGSASS